MPTTTQALLRLWCVGWLNQNLGLRAVAGAAEDARMAGSKPNVLILLVDDWGWGDMGENCLHALQVSPTTFEA